MYIYIYIYIYIWVSWLLCEGFMVFVRTVQDVCRGTVGP